MLFRRETSSCLDTVLCLGKLLWDAVPLVQHALGCGQPGCGQPHARSPPYLGRAMQSGCHAAELGDLTIRTLQACTWRLQPLSDIDAGCSDCAIQSTASVVLMEVTWRAS